MTARRLSAAIVCMLLLLCGGVRSSSAEQALGVGQVKATYRVDLAAFSLGEFELTANFNGSAYDMKAKAKFSLLAGMLYRGSGTTTSAGKLTDAAPEPSSFTLDYKGNDKREQRQMSFAGGTVSKVSIIPNKKPNPRNVPVTAQQLEDALDPLTAAFLYARSDGPSGGLQVCNQTIPVFDGRQRFDIVLTPKRADSLESRAPSNLAGPVAVCQVKFRPIGGYRPDHPGIKYMTETNEIEASLVAVPGTDLYIPYRISVPTAMGRGSATLIDVKLRSDGRLRAAN